MQVYVICSLQIVFYVFLCYSFVCYSFALYAFVFYVFVLHAFVFYAFVFYALYSMHYILCIVTLKLVTNGPTDIVRYRAAIAAKNTTGCSQKWWNLI